MLYRLSRAPNEYNVQWLELPRNMVSLIRRIEANVRMSDGMLIISTYIYF